jgi:hypothetical protein
MQYIKPIRAEPRCQDEVIPAPIGLEWEIWASIGRIWANQGSLESSWSLVCAKTYQL